jgi:hypothetical protein
VWVDVGVVVYWCGWVGREVFPHGGIKCFLVPSSFSQNGFPGLAKGVLEILG